MDRKPGRHPGPLHRPGQPTLHRLNLRLVCPVPLGYPLGVMFTDVVMDALGASTKEYAMIEPAEGDTVQTEPYTDRETWEWRLGDIPMPMSGGSKEKT